MQDSAKDRDINSADANIDSAKTHVYRIMAKIQIARYQYVNDRDSQISIKRKRDPCLQDSGKDRDYIYSLQPAVKAAVTVFTAWLLLTSQFDKKAKLPDFALPQKHRTRRA